MSTTVISTGLSTNSYATNEKTVQMYKTMFRSYSNLTPFTYILSKLGTDTTMGDRVDWTEDNELPTTIRVTETAAAGATQITVADHYTYLRNHDMLWNPTTFELIKVGNSTAEDAADSTIEVIKGWASTTAAVIVSGQELEIISPAYYESSEETHPRSPVKTNFYNFTQEIKDSIRTSDRNMEQETHFTGKGGIRRDNQKAMTRTWRIKLEKALMFSYRADAASTESGKTSQYIKTMGGLVEKLYNGPNYFPVGGPLTETALDDWLTQIYEGAPDTTSLLMLCAPRVYTRINQMVKPLIRLSPNAKRYGMNLKNYDGPVSLDIVRHPLLKGDMRGWAFVLDMTKVKLIYQKKPIMQRDVAMKRFNYVEDQMKALVTLLVAEGQRHGMATGIT